MSLINTTIKPFKATAYWNGKEINLTEADVLGLWSVVPISMRPALANFWNEAALIFLNSLINHMASLELQISKR